MIPLVQLDLGLRRVASNLRWSDYKTVLFISEASMMNSRLFFLHKAKILRLYWLMAINKQIKQNCTSGNESLIIPEGIK